MRGAIVRAHQCGAAGAGGAGAIGLQGSAAGVVSSVLSSSQASEHTTSASTSMTQAAAGPGVPVCTPVRYAVYPRIAAVIQGQTDSLEGVSTNNARSPLPFVAGSGGAAREYA